MIRDLDLALSKISLRVNSGAYEILLQIDVFDFKFKPLKHRLLDKFRMKSYEVTLTNIKISGRFFLSTH